MRWTEQVHKSRFGATVEQVKRRSKDDTAEDRLPGVPEKNSPVRPLLLSASAVGFLVALRRSATLRRTLKGWAAAPWNALQHLTHGSGKKPAAASAGQPAGNRGPVASTSKAAAAPAPAKPTTPKAQPKPASAAAPAPAKPAPAPPAAAPAPPKPSSPAAAATAAAAAALAPRPTPSDDQPVASTSGGAAAGKKKNKKKNKKK